MQSIQFIRRSYRVIFLSQKLITIQNNSLVTSVPQYSSFIEITREEKYLTSGVESQWLVAFTESRGQSTVALSLPRSTGQHYIRIGNVSSAVSLVATHFDVTVFFYFLSSLYSFVHHNNRRQNMNQEEAEVKEKP